MNASIVERATSLPSDVWDVEVIVELRGGRERRVAPMPRGKATTQTRKIGGYPFKTRARKHGYLAIKNPTTHYPILSICQHSVEAFSALAITCPPASVIAAACHEEHADELRKHFADLRYHSRPSLFCFRRSLGSLRPYIYHR